MDVASWPSARCLGPVRHGVGRASPEGDRGLHHLRITRQHCPSKGAKGENRREAAARPYALCAAASRVFCATWGLTMSFGDWLWGSTPHPPCMV